MTKDSVSKTRRRKGQGSITKKENGTYLGRIKVAGYDPYSCTGTSRKEVERKLEEFRLRTLKKEVVAQKITVNAYIEKWLENVKKPTLKPASYDRLERTYLNHIMRSPVGRSQLGGLTSRDIQELINEKSETLSYSSLKKIYELLNGCLSYAVAGRELDYNPILTVRLPKEENLKKRTKQMEIFTEEELERIEEVAKVTYNSGEPRYRYANFFILLANTGLRCGEGLALRWQDVDLEQKMIHVKQNASVVKDRSEDAETKYKVIVTSVKTRSGNRTVPCNEKAMRALLWYKKYQESHRIKSEYVICNDAGGMVRQKSLPKSFKAVLNAAEVPYKNIHSLRHSFASSMVAGGADIKLVAVLLGHASTRTAHDTYVHSDMATAVEAVNKLYKKKKGERDNDNDNE